MKLNWWICRSSTDGTIFVWPTRLGMGPSLKLVAAVAGPWKTKSQAEKALSTKPPDVMCALFPRTPATLELPAPPAEVPDQVEGKPRRRRGRKESVS